VVNSDTNLAISSLKIFQLGLFLLKVAQASGTISRQQTFSQPASSNPNANPPAPANISATFSLLLIKSINNFFVKILYLSVFLKRKRTKKKKNLTLKE
jgi:hypothetical protein